MERPALAIEAYIPSPWLTRVGGWAVGGGGTILRWNGSTWRSIPSPSTKELNAVALVSANDGWIVGSEGVILRTSGSANKSYLPLIIY